MVVILLSLAHLVVSVDKVGEEEVELPDRDVDVIGVDTEGGVEAVWGLLQSLPIRRLKGNCLEEDNLDEVEPPDLVGLSKAINPPHLALLVGVGEDAHCRLLARDGEHKVLPALLGNVLPQLTQQPRGPLLLHLCLFSLQKYFWKLFFTKFSLKFVLL